MIVTDDFSLAATNAPRIFIHCRLSYTALADISAAEEDILEDTADDMTDNMTDSRTWHCRVSDGRSSGRSMYGIEGIEEADALCTRDNTHDRDIPMQHRYRRPVHKGCRTTGGTFGDTAWHQKCYPSYFAHNPESDGRLCL